MFDDLVRALALLFIFEGILPFAFPKRWEETMLKAINQDDKVLRISGFISMLVGLVLLTLVREYFN